MDRTYSQNEIDWTSDQNPFRHQRTIAAVGPNGQFMIRHVPRVSAARPDASFQIGDVPIIVHGSQALISDKWRARGWVLYEDLCMGRVNGIDADQEAWNRWERFIAFRAKGNMIGRDALPEDEFYHKEVLARRAKHRSLSGRVVESAATVAEMILGKSPDELKGKGRNKN